MTSQAYQTDWTAYAVQEESTLTPTMLMLPLSSLMLAPFALNLFWYKLMIKGVKKMLRSPDAKKSGGGTANDKGK